MPVIPVRSVSATIVYVALASSLPEATIEPSASLRQGGAVGRLERLRHRAGPTRTAVDWVFSHSASLAGERRLVRLQLGLELGDRRGLLLLPARRASGRAPPRRRPAPPSPSAMAASALAAPASARSSATSTSRLPSASASLRGRPRSTAIVLAAGVDLRRRRRAVQDAQEELLDQLGVVRLASRRAWRARCSGRRWRRRRVGPLTSAITGPSCRPLVRSHSQALSRDRPAERVEEAARQLDARVGQLRGPRARRHARELRRRAGRRGGPRRTAPRPAAAGRWRASS